VPNVTSFQGSVQAHESRSPEHQGLRARHGALPCPAEPALDSTRLVVLAGQRVSNPPFYGELIKMGFEAASLPVSLMAAITSALSRTRSRRSVREGRIARAALIHALSNPANQFFLSLLVLVRQVAMSLKKLPGIVTFVLNSTQHSGNFN